MWPRTTAKVFLDAPQQILLTVAFLFFGDAPSLS
jgi:hypothetical protein